MNQLWNSSSYETKVTFRWNWLDLSSLFHNWYACFITGSLPLVTNFSNEGDTEMFCWCSPGCESDYVQLYESMDTSGHTRGKKCGNYYRSHAMYTLTNYAYLHFHTNGSNETPNLKGFRLHYTAVDIDECDPRWKKCSHGCHNFEGGYECSCPEGFFMSSDGNNCFGKGFINLS